MHINLTLKQIDALLRVKDDHVSRGRYLRIQGAVPIVIGELFEMGLIEWRETASSTRAFLTPKGSLVLKDNVSRRSNKMQEEKGK